MSAWSQLPGVKPLEELPARGISSIYPASWDSINPRVSLSLAQGQREAVERTQSRKDRSEFKSQPCHLPAVRPQKSYFTFLTPGLFRGSSRGEALVVSDGFSSHPLGKERTGVAAGPQLRALGMCSGQTAPPTSPAQAQAPKGRQTHLGHPHRSGGHRHGRG